MTHQSDGVGTSGGKEVRRDQGKSSITMKVVDPTTTRMWKSRLFRSCVYLYICMLYVHVETNEEIDINCGI